MNNYKFSSRIPAFNRKEILSIATTCMLSDLTEPEQLDFVFNYLIWTKTADTEYINDIAHRITHIHNTDGYVRIILTGDSHNPVRSQRIVVFQES